MNTSSPGGEHSAPPVMAPLAPAVTPLGKQAGLLRWWQIRWALSAALLGLLLAVPVWLWLGPQASWRGFLAVLPVLGLALGCLFGMRRFALYRARLHQGEGVVLCEGLWWRSEVWVPNARIQHIDVNQGPLDRRWDMATLSLHTAGSHDHRTRIHGLPVAQAHALREQLLPRQVLEHD